MNRAAAISLIVIVVLGSFLRLYGLGKPSFWVDEVNHVYAAKSLLQGEEPVYPSGAPNNRSLLYSGAVAVSFKLFGVNEFAARLPSAVFGILAIVAVYFVALRWFGNWTAVVASFLLAFSHLTIGWSRISRMYTLFQLLYLVAAYLFYEGLEAVQGGGGLLARGGPLARARTYLVEQRVKLWPIVAAALLLLISYSIHMLTGLFAVSVILYAGVLLVLLLPGGGARQALTSKYALILAAAALGTLVGLAVFNLDSMVRFALGFRPLWADYGSVQDTNYFYYFFTDTFQFPWAAFFLLGTIQMVTRANKRAFYAFVNFIVPLGLLSFVFAYRVPNYIVHVYPFYVMIIGYAVSNLLEAERPAIARSLKQLGVRRQKWLQQIVLVVVFFGWVPLTLWFRYAVKLPFIGESGKNGAVAHVAWRQAVEYVKQNKGPDDVVVSTLPLTVHYYLGSVDYNLNRINLDESLKWVDGKTEHDRGYYTGAPAIQTVSDFERVMEKHGSGFLLADVYRFEHTQYVPADIADYVRRNLQLVWEDRGRTIRVYRWSNDTTK